MTRHVPSGRVTTSRRGSFWVGLSDRVDRPLGSVLRGPTYVEWEAPAEPAPRTTVVPVHGGGGQGTDYLTTPDGRLGWSRGIVGGALSGALTRRIVGHPRRPDSAMRARLPARPPRRRPRPSPACSG